MDVYGPKLVLLLSYGSSAASYALTGASLGMSYCIGTCSVRQRSAFAASLRHPHEHLLCSKKADPPLTLLPAHTHQACPTPCG